MGADKRQAKALAKNFRRLAFQACGQCGTRGSIYIPLYPKLMRCERWCYMCGAKDGETRAGGRALHDATVLALLERMSLEERRAELIKLKGEQQCK